jgi:Phage tail tube protein, GTA-gp10
MANRHRGEIDAEFDGRTYTLCLTLGALAELEASFGDQDMLAVAKRFESGRLGARDAIRILGAGLRGGGHEISDAQVAAMKCKGGAAGTVAVVAELLSVTFGGATESEGPSSGSATPSLHDVEDETSPPFPGRG